jgi:molecular chaperone GrpE
MSDERRAAREAEGQVKVVDRRRFGPDGTSMDPSREGEAPAPEDAGATAGPAGPAPDERDAQLAIQAARIDELTRAYATLLEDNKAFRQRLERERQRVLEAERAQVAQTLLEAADDLERALSAAGEDVQGELRSLVEGVRLSLDVLHRRIAAVGAQRIAVVGLPFDPHLAEAMDTVPVGDAALDGIVVQEVRPGYRIGDRVLRPAGVRVGRIARA